MKAGALQVVFSQRVKYFYFETFTIIYASYMQNLPLNPIVNPLYPFVFLIYLSLIPENMEAGKAIVESVIN